MERMSREPFTVEEVASELARFAGDHWGPQAMVEEVGVMQGGHAGLTFGFQVTGAGLAQDRSFILKLAPRGVRRSGNTDVFRQAPLLRALRAAGLPVPGVPYADAGEAWFGTPFVMMERLAGQTFFVWEPDAAHFDLSAPAVESLWLQAIDALALLHRFDWRSHLADWEPPRTLRDEVLRWTPILEKSPDPQWAAQGRAVRDRLLATLPVDAPFGLVHGDFQPGNVLYAQGRLTGVIDWELAGIGSRRIDAGWLMMFADARSWVTSWRPLCPLTPEAIAGRYAARMREDGADLVWYQAFAGYRLGAITCMNVYLHRSGRRPDDTWERFAAAVPHMFGRAARLLDEFTVPAGVSG